MRRKFSILLALPATNALSLANFQSISVASIPLVCQLTYDGQIPNCQVSDFNTGCTVACVAGLNSIAADVISACDGTHVTASSLLGIIQAGGIQGALCPTLAKVSTSTKAKTTSAVEASTVSPALSVTLPTDSAGVTGGLGFKTSSSSSSSPTSTATAKATTTHASSTISVTVKSSKTAQSTATADSSTASSTSSIESAAGSSVQTTFSTTTSATNKGSVQTSSGNAQTTTKAASNNGVSGGGSPFDIQSSAHRVGGQSILGFVIFAAWAGILLGR